jgi:hypothetical protein
MNSSNLKKKQKNKVEWQKKNHKLFSLLCKLIYDISKKKKLSIFLKFKFDL